MKTFQKHTLLIALFFVASLFIFSACNKKKEETNPQNQAINQSSIDNSSSETEYEEVQSTVDDVMEKGEVTQNLRARGAAKVTVTTDGCQATVDISVERDTLAGLKTRTVIIDFGTTGNCKSQNGQRTRKGKLVTVLTVPAKITVTNANGQTSQVAAKFSLATPGATHVTTFENYFVNDIKVEGKRTVTNISTSISSNPKHKIVVENGKLTYPATNGAVAKVATWKSERTREWVSGHQTIAFFGVNFLIPDLNPFNDVFKIYGTYSGTNRNGNAYVAEVKEAEAIEIHTECWKKLIGQPVKGKMTLTSENSVAVIDYGTGECDATFTVTINGSTYTVKVEK